VVSVGVAILLTIAGIVILGLIITEVRFRLTRDQLFDYSMNWMMSVFWIVIVIGFAVIVITNWNTPL
jgi:hypothetical protein